MKRRASIQDVIDEEVIPALGEDVADYTAEAIAAIAHEAWTWTVDTDENGAELLNTEGFEQTASTEEFWEIAGKHRTVRRTQDEPATEAPTHFTAWLGVEPGVTLGDLCDVSVTEDEPAGYGTDEDGREVVTEWTTKPGGGEPFRADTTVPANGGDHEAAQSEAETLLAGAGWTTIGTWDDIDTGYKITVVPATRDEPATEGRESAESAVAACTPNSQPFWEDGRQLVGHGYQINVLDSDLNILATVDLPDWHEFRPASAGHRLIEIGWMIRPDVRGPETVNGWSAVGPGWMTRVIRIV